MKIAAFTTAAFIAALGATCAQAEQPREWLFVSTGLSALAVDNQLTIQDSDGKAFGFTDRPYREHANLTTDQLASLWDVGASFSADPPNAVLTYMVDGQPHEVEIILNNATAAGDTMSFGFEIVSGEIVSDIGAFSLFIDGIFIPFDSSF